MYLTELFDRKIEDVSAKETNDMLDLVTQIDDTKIRFRSVSDRCRFAPPGELPVALDLWNFEFWTLDSGKKFPDIKLTGSGQQFKVMPFIIQCVRRAEQKAIAAGTPAFKFSADRREPSRISLYRRLAKSFGTNYWISTWPDQDDINFYAIDKKYLSDVIAQSKTQSDKPLRLSGRMAVSGGS